MTRSANLQKWMDFFESHNTEHLASILADDAVFHSPVVHTPQVGKPIVLAYLSAAGETLGNDTFRYVREIDGGNQALLEFETEMDGIHVNGVDIITWNDDGLICDFKVMVRPLKAVNQVHASMKAMLEKMKSGA